MLKPTATAVTINIPSPSTPSISMTAMTSMNLDAVAASTTATAPTSMQNVESKNTNVPPKVTVTISSTNLHITTQGEETVSENNAITSSSNSICSAMEPKFNTDDIERSPANTKAAEPVVHKTEATATTDLDPMNIMEWKNGIGILPGSYLKFKINEFGTLEMVDEKEAEELMNKHTTNNTDGENMRRSVTITGTGSSSVTPATGQYDICTCVNCGVQGESSSFIRQGKFCSQDCATIQSTHIRLITRKNSAVALKESSKRKIGKPKAETFLQANKPAKLRKLSSDKLETTSPSNSRSQSPETLELYEANNEVEDIETLTNDGKTFCWKSYLTQTRSYCAPQKCFKDLQLFPQSNNDFKPGMKLEGVDPQHPSLFCVLSVAEVAGYRIRLHFDGFRDIFDFWVNADCPFIFPPLWCEKTGRKLQPPKGIAPADFNWHSYLLASNAQGAPKTLFTPGNRPTVSNFFSVGMKLEAVDKANSSLVCVATIADIIDNWLLIHFDGWDDSYDYWTDSVSPHIHPVNWCRSKGRSLTPPKDYPKSSERFSWDEYLSETKSVAAPARAFKMRPSNTFKAGMKLEAVDRRNPKFIRVATIYHRASHSIKIHFDGWDEKYDYWVDDDSPDIHPVNWCSATGHPILVPPQEPKENNRDLNGVSQCPTPGCNGLGHLRGPRYLTHHSSPSCPYADQNLDHEAPDRLGKCPPEPLEFDENSLNTSPTLPSNPPTPILNSHKTKKRKFSVVNGNSENCPASPSSYSDSIKLSRPSTPSSSSHLSALQQSIFALRINQQQQRDAPVAWEKHSKVLLPLVEKIKPSEVLTWNPEQVARFVSSIPGCGDFGQAFLDELVDGEAFLLLNQPDLTKILRIKLGPAVKIYNSILVIRENMNLEDP